ncbi:Protein DEHYDRATION-INDUCED 19 6 [Glycine soja]|uniref:Protein DEHYDRATION-INDUCED 19-like 6 n=1 Tax=Glycine soja TaxID=3848 RepID=A0A445IWJ1_GLYSO|nr:Protein DEHYDRATION-INDUCED 19-like 6 [Glycine soja]
MDSDSWISTRMSSSSRRYHSRSDLYVEESEGSDDFRAEFLCPFCAEDYDVVSLCCHIDDHHPIQAKNGVRSFLRKLTSIGSYIAKLFTLCVSHLWEEGGIGSRWTYYYATWELLEDILFAS